MEYAISVEVSNSTTTLRSSARRSSPPSTRIRATRRAHEAANLQSSRARTFSAIVAASNPVSEGTTHDFASSGRTQSCLAIAARRTCDCAEIDLELESPLKLTCVTLPVVYVAGTDSGLASLRLSTSHAFCFSCALVSPSETPKVDSTHRTIFFQSCLPSGVTHLLASSQHAHLCMLSVKMTKIPQWGLQPSCGHPIDRGRQMSTTLRHAGRALV
jgi:hypothetical protein